jgi:hypothetical protein
MGIREVPVECPRDAVWNCTLLGQVVARQDSQQVTEELATDEVVVNETVVLLPGIGLSVTQLFPLPSGGFVRAC